MISSNIPEIKLGIVAVSRDCFPIELSRKRLNALTAAAKKAKLELIAAETVIETEKDALKALDELRAKGANAAVVYLGNFGPEGSLRDIHSAVSRSLHGLRRRGGKRQGPLRRQRRRVLRHAQSLLQPQTQKSQGAHTGKPRGAA